MKKHKILLLIFLSIIIISFSSVLIMKLYSDKDSSGKYKEFITVDVFDSLANYQGIQGGWFAKIVKDKFNMELNIIAPNVSGGGDTLFESKLVTGDLGDLIIWGGSSTQYNEMISSGLLLDMSKYLKDKKIMRYKDLITTINTYNQNEKIYAIPTYLSSLSPYTPANATDPNYGPYLRWDLYSELGYPKISTLEDLLPVLVKMKELMPLTESGESTYAFSFFKDWDGSFMNEAKHIANIYGYDPVGFVLAKGDGTDYQNILDPNSLYMRGLKFYFNANQLGLVDPNSPYQNYSQSFQKYKNGDIFYCNLSWIAMPAYNTTDHLNDGKAFMMASIDDMKIYCDGIMPLLRVIGIGSKAKDPKRLADFIDWLYSPEGISLLYTESNVTAGPKGLTWNMNESGPYLTDFGKQVFFAGDTEVPEKWGGGTWSEGLPKLNIIPVVNRELDDNGYPYAYTLWDSVLSMDVSTVEADWRRFSGAKYTLEYLDNTNQILISTNYNYNDISDSDDIYNKRALCSKYIVDYSWKMIFAKDEVEFNDLYQELISFLKTLGYDDVVAFDMKKAMINNEERQNKYRNNSN